MFGLYDLEIKHCYEQPLVLDVVSIMNLFVLVILEFHPVGYKDITVVGNSACGER